MVDAGVADEGDAEDVTVPSHGTFRHPLGALCHWTVRNLVTSGSGGCEVDVIALWASPEGVCGLGRRLPWDETLPVAAAAVLDEVGPLLAGGGTLDDRRRMGSHFVGWFGMLVQGRVIGPNPVLDGPGPSRVDAFRAYADALDPVLVHGVGNASADKPYGFRDDILGLCWPGLDRTLCTDDSLRLAFGALPGLEALAVDAWVEDGDAFRAAARRGDVRRHVAARTVARGILPARLLPAAAAFAAEVPPSSHQARAMASRKPPTPRNLGTYDMSPWHCPPVDAVRRLVPMPASWVPSGPAEWEGFAALCPVMDRFAPMVADEAGWSGLLNHGGRWADHVERLEGMFRKAGGDPADATTGAADMGLHDVARAYAMQVLAPAVAAATDGSVVPAHWDAWTDAARSLLFSGRSLSRQVEVSLAWHRAQHRIRAEIAGIAGPGNDPLAWRAGLPDATYGDVSIRVLTDERQLVAEGAYRAEDGSEGLDHCVGGYGPVCRRKGTRILSLRRSGPEGSFERLSTAHVDAAGGRLDVEEHRGRRNGSPDRGAVAALARYADDIASGALVVDVGGLAPMPDDDPLAACGHDAADPGQRAAVRGMWRPFLPGTVAAMDETTLAGFAGSLLGRPTWRTLPFGHPADPVPALPSPVPAPAP